MDYEYLPQDREGSEARMRDALARGAQAFARLVAFAERSDTGQARVVATFVGKVAGQCQFDLYDLRTLDQAVTDDILKCIAAIAWPRNLTDLIPDGFARALKVVREFGIGPGLG